MKTRTAKRKKSGSRKPIGELLRTAGLAGAAGAALAGAVDGEFSLAPISEAQAQAAPAMPIAIT